jgi:parallel beta-helix repeat protein
MKRKTSALTIILLSLFTTLVVAQFGDFVSSNIFPTPPPINSVYIRADGSIKPSTAPITIENHVYTLIGDLTNTTLKIERDGVVLDGAGYAIIGNSFNFHEGVDITNRTNITIRNLVINQFGTGILMDNASRNTVKGNKITTYNAFTMTNADNNTIVGNTAVNLDYGIFGTGSYNQIADNNFSSDPSGGDIGTGISLWSSNGNALSRNTISHEIGINLARAQHNIISNNTIIGVGSKGIILTRASNNQVFGNIIKENADALHISAESFNNIIFENTFERNTFGVALSYHGVEVRWENVYNNTLYRNSFVNNVQDVWIVQGTPINYWDNGQQGNFWSDYNGIDNNNDGIGDTPYIIDENNSDNFPLMMPYVTSPSEPELFPTTFVVVAVIVSVAVVGIGLLVYFKKRKH